MTYFAKASYVYQSAKKGLSYMLRKGGQSAEAGGES